MKHLVLVVVLALATMGGAQTSTDEHPADAVAATRASVVASVRGVHAPGLTGATLGAPARDAGGCDFLVDKPQFLRGMRVSFVFPLSTSEQAMRHFVVGRRASFEVELPLPVAFYQDGHVQWDREPGQLIYLSEDPSGLFEWKKEAEPGATDNPDDAQRLREDH